MDFFITENSEFQKLLNKEKEVKRSDIHSFHRYFGKLIPAIPLAAIKYYTEEEDWVYDPFAGSGTTLLEAKLNDRNAIGTEINPISCFFSKTKTTELDVQLLQDELNEKLLKTIYEDINNPEVEVTEEEKPFCINRDNWFKDFVQRELIIIKRNIDIFFKKNDNYNISPEDKKNILNFYTLVLSSIIRNVSNADPQHVFPGYSKRLRKLDAEGKRKINVYNSFRLALRKRTKALKDFEQKKIRTDVIIKNVNSKDIDFNQLPKAKLIVTNPPYISSIRYIETMKLELYWMEYLLNQKEYKELESTMIGNDRISKKECKEIKYTKYKEINEIIDRIYSSDEKSGVVVSNYFNEMEEVIKNMNRALYLDGHVVMKISDSKVKKIKVETGRFLTYIAQEYGFILENAFIDKIQNRSLLTARNSYSDIITHDYIVIWKKVAEI